ncbi:MAG: S-layer homology domain-containing protein, partial [Oscillospiraceae bacterium]|nr:S-layer homology domain-containing protein [Oscillospiraceae bacterium]
MLRRLTALLLTAAMIFGFGRITDSPKARAVTFSDTVDSWAKTPIDRWSSYGVISGYSGTEFRPNASITRAELFKIIASTMNYSYTPSNPFTDIYAGDWYYSYILQLVGAGVVKGDAGKVRPNDYITRQEAFAIFARVFRISADENGIAGFPDTDDCAYWARGEVGGLVRSGYVNGQDGFLRPTRNITRAETVKILDSIIYGYIASGESTDTDINGVTVINSPGAELHDMHVNGDLFITQGVGDGEVTLDNVIVNGDIYISGGGEHSVLIRGKSRVGTVYVRTPRNWRPVRISFAEPAEANTIAIENDCGAVYIDGIVNRLLLAQDTTAYVNNATVKTVDLNGIGATLNINSNGVVNQVRANAERVRVNVGGTVEHMLIDRSAVGTNVDALRSGIITEITTWANDCNVSGLGVLRFVEVEEGRNTRVTVNRAIVEVSLDAGGVKTGDAVKDWIPPGETGVVGSGDLENALNVKKVLLLDDGSLQVEFSKEVDKTKGQNAANYTLSGDAIQYTSTKAAIQPSHAEVNGKLVKLMFSNSPLRQLKSGETAIVTVVNVTAKDGSPLGVTSGIYRKP